MIIIVISLPLHFPFSTSKKRREEEKKEEKNRKEMKPIEMSGKKHTHENIRICTGSIV